MKKKMTQRHLELLIEIYDKNGTKTAKEICKDDRQKQLLFIDLLDAKCIYIDKNKIVTVNRRYEFELAEKLQYQQVLKDAPQEEHEQDWIIRMNYTSKESKERHERYLRRLENVEKLHERQAQQEEEERRKEYKKTKGW